MVAFPETPPLLAARRDCKMTAYGTPLAHDGTGSIPDHHRLSLPPHPPHTDPLFCRAACRTDIRSAQSSGVQPARAWGCRSEPGSCSGTSAENMSATKPQRDCSLCSVSDLSAVVRYCSGNQISSSARIPLLQRHCSGWKRPVELKIAVSSTVAAHPAPVAMVLDVVRTG